MSDPRAPESAVAALADPVRRRLFDLLQAEARPLGRDELAERTGLPRATVAFHLDRLAEAGALTVAFARLTGRSGPGAGRPAKLYAVAGDELSASIPPRSYDVVGDLLATAVEEADRTGAPVRECLVAVAEERGHALGAGDRPLSEALATVGYEPEAEADGGLRLTNCPFHRLASRHTELICSANVALVRGISDESDGDREVWLEPTPGQCCVRIGPPAQSLPRTG